MKRTMTLQRRLGKREWQETKRLTQPSTAILILFDAAAVGTTDSDAILFVEFQDLFLQHDFTED